MATKAAVWVLATLFSSALARPLESTPYQGCSKSGFEVDSTGHITRDLGGRTYILHVPQNYTKGQPHPLLLSFHGAGGSAPFQEHMTEFSDEGLTIAGLPYIVAYPQGAPEASRHGLAGWQPAPYANQSVDDITFIKDVVSDISDNYCIDPLRVYGTGKSNGGGLQNYLACRPDTSRIFAAFAMASAALYPQTLAFEGCEPARPIPIITAHGTADNIIHYKGQEDDGTGSPAGLATPDVMTWRQAWAERNGCANGTKPIVEQPYPHTVKYTWKCQADVVGFTVYGLVHSWPTTKGLDTHRNPPPEATKASFDWSKSDVLDFFTANPLPAYHIGY